MDSVLCFFDGEMIYFCPTAQDCDCSPVIPRGIGRVQLYGRVLAVEPLSVDAKGENAVLPNSFIRDVCAVALDVPCVYHLATKSLSNVRESVDIVP